MNIFQKRTSFLAILIVLGIIFVGCDSGPINSGDEQNVPIAESERPHFSPQMINTNASFPVFKQDFNQDLYPWNLETNAGGLWCGSIERIEGSTDEVQPSAGRAFAQVQQGKCIKPFRPLTSAPASGPIPKIMSTTFPESGYVQQIDVYLDPKYSAVIDGPNYEGNIEGLVIPQDASEGPTLPRPSVDGVVLTYAVSICVLNESGVCPIPDGLYYFPISVTKENGAMKVADREVTDAGWYTFRYVFDSDAAGNLTVDFELIKNDQLLNSVTIENTLNTNDKTSKFKTKNLGSGYSWFASIADGLALPIDEFKLQPGK